MKYNKLVVHTENNIRDIINKMLIEDTVELNEELSGLLGFLVYIGNKNEKYKNNKKKALISG